MDGLRGLLALGVFIHHFVILYYYQFSGKWQAPPTVFYRLTGHAGFAMFFMITGFLFWHRILITGGRLPWGRFFISRVFRIVPLYLFLLAVITVVVFWIGGLELKVPPGTLAKQYLTWLTFRGAPDINAFADTARLSGVTWSLTYEWAFYASLPLLAWVALRKWPGSFPAPAIALAVAAVVSGAFAWTLPILGLNTKFFTYFLVGALCACAYRNGRLKALAETRAASFAALAALASLFIWCDEGTGAGQLVTMSVFFLCVALGNSLFGLLGLPAMRLLGEISYSIYLLHGLVLYTAFWILFPGSMGPGTPVWQIAAILIGTGTAVVILAWISFLAIEKPFMGLGRRLAGAPVPKAESMPTAEDSPREPQKAAVPPN